MMKVLLGITWIGCKTGGLSRSSQRLGAALCTDGPLTKDERGGISASGKIRLVVVDERTEG